MLNFLLEKWNEPVNKQMLQCNTTKGCKQPQQIVYGAMYTCIAFMVSVRDAVPLARSCLRRWLSGIDGVGRGPAIFCSSRTDLSSKANCEAVTTSMLPTRGARPPELSHTFVE